MVDAGIYSHSGGAGAVPVMNFWEKLQLYITSSTVGQFELSYSPVSVIVSFQPPSDHPGGVDSS